MRALVFLLVFVNLLFFVWAQGYFGAPANPDAFRMQQQLKADQLTIIGRGEHPAQTAEAPTEAAETPDPAPTPAPVAIPEKKPEVVEKPPEKKESNSCWLWSDLPVNDADKIERLIVGKYTSLKLKRSSTLTSKSYWVFIPPSGNRQEAEAKAAETRQLGAPELLIVQEAGPNRLAISLGVFSTLEAANKRLDALREKGITGALAGERNAKPPLATLEVRGPQKQADALREAANTLLPKGTPASCKVAAR